jgi:hypothetical protein
MIFYVIKNRGEVTQAQLNASNARKIENLRVSNDGTKCVLKFEDSSREYFMGEAWLTFEEIQREMEKSEWNPEVEAPSFMSKALAFIGLK